MSEPISHAAQAKYAKGLDEACDLGDLFPVAIWFNEINKIRRTQIVSVCLLFTRNTLADLDARNKSRFSGLIHNRVKKICIMIIGLFETALIMVMKDAKRYVR